MSGSARGGQKAAATNKQKDAEYLAKYGMTFYQYIGSKGGKKSTTGGFASTKVGPDGLTGPQRASRSGQIGGTISRKGSRNKPLDDYKLQYETPKWERQSFLARFKKVKV